jgi:hypothetical protein
MEKKFIYKSHENNLKLRKVVYYLLGVLETFFAFRLIFKLLGANPGSAFVTLIYTISGTFQAPFNGIFRSAVNKGTEIKSVLDSTTIIAMVVYALIAYGVVRLIEIYKTPQEKELR